MPMSAGSRPVSQAPPSGLASLTVEWRRGAMPGQDAHLLALREEGALRAKRLVKWHLQRPRLHARRARACLPRERPDGRPQIAALNQPAWGAGSIPGRRRGGGANPGHGAARSWLTGPSPDSPGRRPRPCAACAERLLRGLHVCARVGGTRAPSKSVCDPLAPNGLGLGRAACAGAPSARHPTRCSSRRPSRRGARRSPGWRCEGGPRAATMQKMQIP